MSSFGLFKEPKNIIELFTFDLTTFFFDDDYQEISSNETDGVFMIEYEKSLAWIELDLFNTVVFRVFNDKNNINGSNHINVRFSCEIDDFPNKQIIQLVNKLHKIYGFDDENLGEWNETDTKNINSNQLIRQYTLGEGKNIYTVRLSFKNNFLLLEILFFNHLLELINQH